MCRLTIQDHSLKWKKKNLLHVVTGHAFYLSSEIRSDTLKTLHACFQTCQKNSMWFLRKKIGDKLDRLRCPYFVLGTDINVNSVDPDEMAHNPSQDLHCLPSC